MDNKNIIPDLLEEIVTRRKHILRKDIDKVTNYFAMKSRTRKFKEKVQRKYAKGGSQAPTEF